MNNALFEELLALRQKRPLTPEEQTRLDGWLAKHPADRTRWTEEAALSTALRRLSQPPVPSNFMARVWRDIEAEERRGERQARPEGWFFWPSMRLPGLGTAFSVFAVLLLLVAGSQSKRTPSRTKLAESIEQVATFARVPSVEFLKDFEAISRLNQASADVELLAAFEQQR